LEKNGDFDLNYTYIPWQLNDDFQVKLQFFRKVVKIAENNYLRDCQNI
jgi:hypothetical protein